MATLLVTIVTLGRINIFPATPRALNAPVGLATKPKVPRHAMVFLLVRTVGMAHFRNVTKGTFVKVKPPIKPLANPDPTPPM